MINIIHLNGKKRFKEIYLFLIAAIFVTIFSNCGNNKLNSAASILNEINITRGICVLLGDVNAERAIDLLSSRFVGSSVSYAIKLKKLCEQVF